MADKMAMAMAEGRLDEFMKQNLPDNEHARKLAMMMLGMTGMGSMVPPAGYSASEQDNNADASPSKAEQGEEADQETQVPEDVIRAVHAGNMQELMALLAREHQKRTGSAIGVPPCERKDVSPAPAGIEKEALDELIRIATENNVSLDWLILRALKVYSQEYQKTGRL
jgi:hypothetical protein